MTNHLLAHPEMTTEEMLFGLLREALWGTPFDAEISPDEAQRLIALAKRQTMAGLVIETLLKRNIALDKPVLFEAYALLEQIRLQNRRVNLELAAFARLMAEAKMPCVVVKGQTLAVLYPDPLLRMAGDIDFLVDDYQQAAEALRSCWNISFPRRIKGKEFAFTHGQVLYELHTHLTDYGYSRHRRHWERALAAAPKDQVMIEGEAVTVMKPTLCVTYVFTHLFFHFVHEGIGLRQLCDWAVLLHHHADAIDHERLEQLLRDTGLLRAFKAFGSILVDYLGVSDFPFQLTATDRMAQARIMSDILRGGNFGRERRRAKHVGLLYKAETMVKVFSSSLRYLPLAPMELLLQPYRRAVINLKMLF